MVSACTIVARRLCERTSSPMSSSTFPTIASSSDDHSLICKKYSVINGQRKVLLTTSTHLSMVSVKMDCVSFEPIRLASNFRLKAAFWQSRI